MDNSVQVPDSGNGPEEIDVVKPLVAIIVVAGGDDPRRFAWLETCLQGISEHTARSDYRVYLKNYDVADARVAELADSFNRCARLDHDGRVSATDAYTEGLQIAYDHARHDGARYIVTIDSDATPIHDGWLTVLIDALDDGAVLAGSWNERGPRHIGPHVDPCCLATTVEFVESQALTFGTEVASTNASNAALAHFTVAAERAGLPIHRLRQSNVNAVHDRFGIIYGDLIFHHGWGSMRLSQMTRAGTWEKESDLRIAELGASMMLEHRQEYLAWLRGSNNRNRVFFIVGMHRSGTSCLMACLEACGVRVGEVDRDALAQPRGNFEQAPTVHLNDLMLSRVSARWDDPPAFRLSAEQCDIDGIATILEALEGVHPGAIKDPRSLFTIEGWMHAASNPGLIGTFRHPHAVARSLSERDGMSLEKGYELWRRYNEQLVELHTQHEFPLIEFDLSDKPAYCHTVAGLAGELGLQPRMRGLLHIVESEPARRQVTEELPVPPQLAEIYGYLVRNKYAASAEPVGFVGLLSQWGRTAQFDIETSRPREFEVWAWNLARRAPRPLGSMLLSLRRNARRLRRRHEQFRANSSERAAR